MGLTEQLAAICAEHNLLNVSISAYREDDGRVWYGATAQAMNGAERVCGSNAYGTSSMSAGSCLASAIRDVNAMRAKSVDKIELEAV